MSSQDISGIALDIGELIISKLELEKRVFEFTISYTFPGETGSQKREIEDVLLVVEDDGKVPTMTLRVDGEEHVKYVVPKCRFAFARVLQDINRVVTECDETNSISYWQAQYLERTYTYTWFTNAHAFAICYETTGTINYALMHHFIYETSQYIFVNGKTGDVENPRYVDYNLDQLKLEDVTNTDYGDDYSESEHLISDRTP
jgi:hypothetical protein